MRTLALASLFAWTVSAAVIDVPLHEPQLGRSHAHGYDVEIAAGANAYLVTWGATVDPTGDGTVRDVLYGRRFDAAGAPLDEQAFVIAKRGAPQYLPFDHASVASGDAFYVATLTVTRIEVYSIEQAPRLVSSIERRSEQQLDFVALPNGFALVLAGYDGVSVARVARDGTILERPRRAWNASPETQIAAAANAIGEIAAVWFDPVVHQMRYGIVDVSGAPRPSLTIAESASYALPDVASNGSDFLAAWYDDAKPAISAMRIAAQQERPFVIAPAAKYARPSVSSRGGEYLVGYRGGGWTIETAIVDSQSHVEPGPFPPYYPYLSAPGVVAQGASGLFVAWWTFEQLLGDFRANDGTWRHRDALGLSISRTREPQIPLRSVYCAGSTYVAWTAANRTHAAVTRVSGQETETIALEENEIYVPRDVQLSCAGDGRLLALWVPEAYVAYHAKIFRPGTLEVERDLILPNNVANSDGKVDVPSGDPSVVWNGTSWVIAHAFTNEGIAFRELSTAGDFGGRTLLPRPDIIGVPFGQLRLAWNGSVYALITEDEFRVAFVTILNPAFGQQVPPQKLGQFVKAFAAPDPDGFLLVTHQNEKTSFARVINAGPIGAATTIPFARADALPGVVAARDGWTMWQGNELAEISRAGVLTRISAVLEPGALLYSVAVDEAGTPRLAFTRGEGADAIPRAFLRILTAGRRRAL